MIWESEFTPVILERGYDYFSHGHVESIQKISGGYRGIVSGMEDYLVHIFIDNETGEMREMDCTCPYAEDGRNCKHMVAVLYEIYEQEDDEDTEIEGIIVSDYSKLENIIEDMKPKEVRNELLSILKKDEKLSADFMRKYGQDEKSMLQYISEMKKTAATIVRQCSDRHGYVDWRKANILTSRLVNEVIEPLHDFISDENDAKTAFDVSLYVYYLFHETAIDDSGGETQYFTEECVDLWEEIVIEHEDSNLQKYVLEQLIIASNKIGMGEWMAEEIDDFISEYFNEDGLVLTKLAALDARIESFNNPKSWIEESNLSRCIKERMDYMREIGVAESEIVAFRNQYRYLSSIRRLEMQEFEEEGRIGDLIQLLKESMKLDENWPGLIATYSRKLAECYKKENDIEKYMAELQHYITTHSRGDVNVFSELKECYEKDEWAKKREEIFDILIQKNVDIKPLLASENLRDRLFGILAKKKVDDSVFAKHHLAEIHKYESTLRPEYDEELLDLYEFLLWKISEFAGGRSHYQEIVDFIRKMLVYPKGKERVRKLLESWRFTYDNRPAMQDELRVLYPEIL